MSGVPATDGARRQRATSPSHREAQEPKSGDLGEPKSGDLGDAATTVVADLFKSLMV
eukprot:COSAG01_NODE_21497_length_899_cov_2.292500_1_plen_56_part_10